ncbi:MAG TPA: hypothetical protein GXZ30_04820 [Propionibacterium sp.]|nr:hypothetical protein [Propionibacterium sp.]
MTSPREICPIVVPSPPETDEPRKDSSPVTTTAAIRKNAAAAAITVTGLNRRYQGRACSASVFAVACAATILVGSSAGVAYACAATTRLGAGDTWPIGLTRVASGSSSGSEGASGVTGGVPASRNLATAVSMPSLVLSKVRV